MLTRYMTKMLEAVFAFCSVNEIGICKVNHGVLLFLVIGSCDSQTFVFVPTVTNFGCGGAAGSVRHIRLATGPPPRCIPAPPSFVIFSTNKKLRDSQEMSPDQMLVVSLSEEMGGRFMARRSSWQLLRSIVAPTQNSTRPSSEYRWDREAGHLVYT